ncbi:MAG: SpoIIE family protein phosphatase [Ruminococcus sp.]|nr:SpoIIE family protein phosphatase [Ruminococcus sp.]
MLKVLRKNKALAAFLEFLLSFFAGAVMCGQTGSNVFADISFCGAADLPYSAGFFAGALFRAIAGGNLGRRIVKLAALAIIVIAKLFSDASSQPKNCGIITAAAVMSSGTAVSWLIGELPGKLIFYAVYAFISGVTAFAGAKLLAVWRKKGALDLRGINGAYGALICIAAASLLSTVHIFTLNFGIIFAAALTLFAAFFYGGAAAALCAVLGGAGAVLAASGDAEICVVFAAAGIAAAYSGRRNIFASAAVFAAFSAFIAVFSGLQGISCFPANIVCAVGFFVVTAPCFSRKMILTEYAETGDYRIICQAENGRLADVICAVRCDLERINAHFMSRKKKSEGRVALNPGKGESITGFYEMMKLTEELVRGSQPADGLIYSPDLSRRIAEKLESCGMAAKRVTAAYNDARRLIVQVAFEGRSAPKITDRLYGIIADESGVRGDSGLIPSAVVRTSKEVIAGMYERPRYELNICSASSCADGSEVSGDSFVSFSDGIGREYAVISDGMGSGKNAALESKMTVSLFRRFVCGGVEPCRAVRLVNSVMVNKLGEESFVTFDAMCFDPDTGRADFIKSGAAAAVMRCGGDVMKVAAVTFPLGINSRVEMFKAEQRLETGDMVIMFSDGISDSAVPYVKELLMKQLSLREIVDAIAEKAGVFSHGGVRDDVTVLGIEVRDGRIG